MSPALACLPQDPQIGVWAHAFGRQLANQPEPVAGEQCGETDDLLSATCTLMPGHPMLRHVDRSRPGVLLVWSTMPEVRL